jgi:hypothetical protein
MDGVIANFSKRYKELYHMAPEEARTHREFHGFFDQFIAGGEFATLELMPDAMKLVEYLRNAEPTTVILSSTANEKNFDAISKQKVEWLKTHDIDFQRKFVPGKQHKYKSARPDTLIIDDTESVITDWRKAGGVAIWHKDVESTLVELKFLLENA